MARNKKEHAISGTRWDHWDDHLALQIAIVDTLARSTKPMTKREIVQKLRKTDEAPIGGLTMLLEKQKLVIRERKTGYGNTWFYTLTALGKTAAHDHSLIGKAPTTAGSVSKTGTNGANKHVGIAAEGQSEPHPSVAEDLVADMNELLDRNIDSTTKEALINARVGQGRFRSDLLRLWDGRCAVTGSMTPEVLRASHIKPWRLSSDAERLDPNNGLPLVANLDALFDKGLISFARSGRLLVSPRIVQSERQLLGLETDQYELRKPPDTKTAEYLKDHRHRHGFPL
jgi:hypothetical protein